MRTFKTQPSAFYLTRAPTGRARCRRCRGVVRKGDWRVVERAFVLPGRRTSLVFHKLCAPARALAAVQARAPLDVAAERLTPP